MPAFATTLTVFLAGAVMAALHLNKQQRDTTAHLIDGRRIKVLCVVKGPQASRWTRGHFVIESGRWTWEPGARQERRFMLPSDVRPGRMRPPAQGEGRLNHRFLVMECTSAEGDVLIAALHGRVEHVLMALTRD
ncbi:hypothetical protein ACIRQH_01035 [Streptomyces sp. NPDC102279]|uniref:hypothetical protein n=1 Tax=Streptomyces sp. NPDC102279 TaxID=3366153 RepID=UPI00381D4521